MFKKILKNTKWYAILAIGVALTFSTFTVLNAATNINSNYWIQNAVNSLATNTSGGLATSDIHVAHCYIGLTTATPCSSGGTAGSIGIGTTTTQSGTAGSVLFIGAGPVVQQDNANFFYDATNHRLGLVTAVPTHTLTLGSTATGFASYNTVDQTTNYERNRQFWSGNVFNIVNEFGGTGTTRNLNIQAGTGAQISISSTNIDLNRGGGTLYNVGIGTANGALSSSTSMQSSLAIWHNVNQGGTASYNALFIAPQLTAVGSGGGYLINAGTDTAAGGAGTYTGLFQVGTGGQIVSSSRIGIGTSLIGFSPNAKLQLANDTYTTSATFSTSGFGIRADANTFTSTTSSGTIAATGSNTFGIPTFASSSATTLTNAATIYINGAPTNGTNVTITNPYALYVNAGNSLFNGNISLNTAGNKLNIATGSNASIGTATLSGGTVTVSTTAVTANSKIYLTDATTGALTNVGSDSVGTIVAGTSFVINSTNVLDASNVNWLIIN